MNESTKIKGLDLTGIKVIDFHSLQNRRPVIVIDPDNLHDTISNLQSQDLVHLSTIVGLQENGNLASYYPLSTPRVDAQFTKTIFVKTSVPIDSPILQSIEDLFPVANVYERELTDMLGIEFTGIGNRDVLLLPDDFPTGFYPLRKDMTSRELQEMLTKMNVGGSVTTPLTDYSTKELGQVNDYSISVGPQHPTHKEPIRFQFFVNGENIENVDLRIGFNHRGIEKALEMNNWTQNLYLIERICGICSAAHQLAYTLTAEQIAGVEDEIPDRASWLRVLISEFERIHSHILWYGVLAHDAGYDLMFHISWRDRELIMDLLEKMTGNRVNYSIQAIGGVRRDISPELQVEMIVELKNLRQKVINHKEVMEKEKSFVGRVSNVGSLSKSDAIKFSAVGPTARGSDVDYDLRRDYPYSGYKDIPFKVISRKEGDVFSSLVVRLDETIEAIDMCVYILENLPKGEIKIKVPTRLPVGDAHTRVEAPRGENIHFIRSDGGQGPYRHKVRAPTLSNVVSLLERFKNMQIADIPMIIRLIDPCIGCMERVTFVDINSHKQKTLTGDELISKANRKFRLNQPIRLFR